MNVLFFGASSGIGQSLTYAFARGNNLILVCRSVKSFENIVQKASGYGAKTIQVIEFDLSNDITDLIKKINYKIDLFINLASSTSSIRDDKIGLSMLTENVSVDLINPLKFSTLLIEKNKKMDIIFITSILSKIYSYNRIIYSSFKRLQEKYLKKITSNLFLVTIGTTIDNKIESKKSKKLANKIIKAYNHRQKNLWFGVRGRLLYYIFLLSPIFSNLLIFIKRILIK